VANRNLAAAQAALEETRQAVSAAVRSRYYALLLAEERSKVSEQLSALGSENLTIAKQLFNVGIVDQPDVLLAEAEAARSKATLVAATATRLGAWQELAAAVGEQVIAPQALPSAADALPVLEAGTTLNQVIDGSRAVEVAVRNADAFRSAIALERASTRPDLFVRADAGSNREHAEGRAIGPQFGLELGVSVPLFNRNRAGIAAATSAARAADARVDEVKLDLRGRFAAVFAEYEGARVLVNAYRTDILPKAQRAYELHLEKYQQMVAPYPAVLQAQRTLIELNEQYLQALDRAWAALAALRSSLAVRTLSPGESR
jgi:cobalt-zinc-cadmium efflux system outer membrane protein